MKIISNSIKYFLIWLLIFQTNLIFGQWNWEWGQESTGSPNYGSTINVLSTDFLNNIYCSVQYRDSVFLPDTSFSHQTSYADWDYVIAKYSSRGSFIEALNIHSVPNEFIQGPFIVSDDSLNLYIATSFRYQLFLHDSTFYPHLTSHPWNADNILIKMNQHNDILWSGLIYNYVGDRIIGLQISDDNNIYIGSEHEASGMVHFFDHDSVYFEHNNGLSLVKLDTDGNLIWHREIHSTDVGTSGFKVKKSDNGLVHFFGRAWNNLVIDGDTLFIPPLGDLLYARFIISFDQNGDLIESQFLSTDFWNYDFEINDLNEPYILGQFQDTLILNSDTLIVPDGQEWKLLIKYDTLLNPVWYNTIPVANNLPVNWMRINLDEENLLFTGTCYNTFQIGDTILDLGSKKQVVIGELDAYGELVNIQSTTSTNHIKSFSFILDNCKNPVIGGDFLGQIIFGQDTLISTNGKGYFTKLTRNEPETLFLGSDTIACIQYLINAPIGYQHYSWNDSITDQYSFMVNETGTYYVSCSDERGCWIYDTINVGIHPGLEIELGSDTTIRESDTIVLAIPDEYDSYLWFNGSTSNKLTIIASQYGVRTFPIWVEVIDGPCIESDTLILTIKSEFGIDELDNPIINIYPNPFADNFSIEIKPQFESI
ncbi:MAG: hypothetical protein R2764_14240 [Bacteroidales bacterium]